MSAIDILFEYLPHTIISTVDQYMSLYNVRKIYEWHNFNGILHRRWHPAHITCFMGEGWLEKWYKNGILHNSNGAARIWYYKSGQIVQKDYIINELRHRIDKPAIICYYDSGQLQYEHWYHQGQRHRMNGPAIIGYNRINQVIITRWYHFDEFVHGE